VPELLLCHGVASPSEESKRFKDKTSTSYSEAGIERTDERLVMYFAAGACVYELERLQGDSAEALIAQLGDHELDVDGIVKRNPKLLKDNPFGYTVMIVTGEGYEAMMDPMTLAKILFAETGTLGKTEQSFIGDSILDFGEHVFVVSPSGALVVGDIEDQDKYLYLIAQSMIGVATYNNVAAALARLLYEAPREFSESQLSGYEGTLEKQYETAQYVINDVRDEKLNADARDGLVINLLHHHLSIPGHEERIRVLLEVGGRRVDRARAVKAERDAKRIGAILYAIGIIVGFGDTLQLYLNLTDPARLGFDVVTTLAILSPLLGATLATTIMLFRDVFSKTLKF
jgi:hypothetical protein